jgi:hypothetical protein
MTLAARIEETRRVHAQREAERTAARAAFDTFIQAQFPILNARLIALLREAAGVHTRVVVSELPQTLAVTGRTFTSLAQIVVTLAVTLDSTPRTVRFEPTLDFRSTGQFGRVTCTTDFDVRLRPSRTAELARSLLDTGIEMRGTATADLLVRSAGAWLALTATHLEESLTELLLR